MNGYNNATLIIGSKSTAVVAAIRGSVTAGQSMNLALVNPVGSGKFLVVDQVVAQVDIPKVFATPSSADSAPARAWGTLVRSPVTTGMAAATPLALRDIDPIQVFAAQGFRGVGSAISGTFVQDFVFNAGSNGLSYRILLGPGHSLGVSTESPLDGTQIAMSLLFHELTELLTCITTSQIEPVEMVSAAPGWFASFTPPSPLGVDIAPIALWVRFEAGDMRGFVADDSGKLRDATMIPGFLGYIPPTGVPLVIP